MFENVPKGDVIFMKVSLGMGNILLFNSKNMVGNSKLIHFITPYNNIIIF